MLRRLRADRSACGNHKSKPRELCLQNQILRWCWPHTPPRRTSFFQLLGGLRKRQIWIALVAFGGLWALTQSKDAVRLLCFAQGCEWAARQWHCRGKVSAGWILPRINSTKWIFLFSARYLQTFGTINSGMREHKQLAVSQHYWRVISKKLATVIMFYIFCDPEKAAHPIRCWVSIWDARSIGLLRTSLPCLIILKINLIHETFQKPYYGLDFAFYIFPALSWKAFFFHSISFSEEAMLIFALALILIALPLAKMLKCISNVPFSRLKLLR